MSDEYDPALEEEFPATAAKADAAMQPQKATYPEIPKPTDVLDLDDTLAYTQNVRLRAIQMLNVSLAQEVSTEAISAMLKAAGDMDKAVVSRRRVGIDEAAAKTAEQSQRDGAALLRAITDKVFTVDPTSAARTGSIPSPGDIPMAAPVPGETDIGAQEGTYDAFAKDIKQQL